MTNTTPSPKNTLPASTAAPQPFSLATTGGVNLPIRKGRPGSTKKVDKKPVMSVGDGWAELRHSAENGRLDADADDHFIAVQYDLKMIEDVVRRRGGNVVGGFVNVGYTSVEFERLEEPLQLIEQRVLSFIAVADLSRFGRGDKAFVPLERIWLAGGHLLIGDEPDWDIHDPKHMGEIKEELLRLGRDRDKRTRKWRATAEWKVAQGVPQHVPLGYRKRKEAVPKPGGGRYAKGTAYIPDECRALARDLKPAFEMMVAGDNDQVIADWLHERGHRQANGRRISSGVVGNLRRSVVPKGDVKWDEYVNEGCHEAVVSREFWDQAQRPRSGSKRSRNLGTQMLSDVLRCAGCRYKLYYDEYVDNAGVTRWRWAHPDVPECRARATITEPLVSRYVERVYLDYVRSEQANIGRVRQTITGAATELAELEAAKNEAEARYREHLRDYVMEQNEPEKYKVREERYREEAMAAAQAHSDKQQSMPASCPDGDILTLWPEMPAVEKRDNLMAKYPIVWVRKSQYLDNGVIRRMPFHDRLQFVDVSEVAKYDLPSRNRKRGPGQAYMPHPVTDGWKVNYVLAPPQPRGVQPVMCQSTLYADLKAKNPAELLEVEAARAHFLEHGRSDDEIRAAWAMTGHVKQQTARQLGIPYHAMPATLLKLGLIEEKRMTAQERGRRRLRERSGGTRNLGHEDTLLALLASDGNVAVAASELGVPRPSLYYRRDKYRKWGWLDRQDVPTDEAFADAKELDAKRLADEG
jgi:Recombinase/Bacterial regulatory protein, Fis family